MRTKHWLLALTTGLVPLAHVAAHHSPAMLYDLGKEITITGVVTEFQLGNPHMRIYLDVDNNGTIEKWLAEGGSRTQLMRVGWTEDEVKPGDKVTVRGHPPRDTKQHLIHMEYLTKPDGTEQFAEDIRYDQFNDRRRRPAEGQP
jgi:DNA/RNA endonuclease YhcR with UshA esterase domain